MARGIKLLFFDTKTVTDKVDPVSRKMLSKFGAFVRTRDKSSLKYKDGSAPAGQPPHVHRSNGFIRGKSGKKSQPASPLRELIFFAYNPESRSVMIGPTIGGSASGAPRTIEEGGNATIEDGGKRIRVRIRPRPHTGPAFQFELKKIDGQLKNILK